MRTKVKKNVNGYPEEEVFLLTGENPALTGFGILP